MANLHWLLLLKCQFDGSMLLVWLPELLKIAYLCSYYLCINLILFYKTSLLFLLLVPRSLKRQVRPMVCWSNKLQCFAAHKRQNWLCLSFCLSYKLLYTSITCGEYGYFVISPCLSVCPFSTSITCRLWILWLFLSVCLLVSLSPCPVCLRSTRSLAIANKTVV